jgi:hypothetical protein
VVDHVHRRAHHWLVPYFSAFSGEETAAADDQKALRGVTPVGGAALFDGMPAMGPSA